MLTFMYFYACVTYQENGTVQEIEEVPKNGKYNQHSLDILRKIIPKKVEWHLTILSI